MTNYDKSKLMPAIYVQEEPCGEPLGNYGMEILRNMKEMYPDRYWRLAFSGGLTNLVKRREIELTELKLRLMDELEHRNPRPKTTSFLAVASHMNKLAEQADEVIARELKKSI